MRTDFQAHASMYTSMYIRNKVDMYICIPYEVCIYEKKCTCTHLSDTNYVYTKSYTSHPTCVQSIPTWRTSNLVEPDSQRRQNKSHTSHPTFLQSTPTWRISNLVEPDSQRGQITSYTSQFHFRPVDPNMEVLQSG